MPNTSENCELVDNGTDLTSIIEMTEIDEMNEINEIEESSVL